VEVDEVLHYVVAHLLRGEGRQVGVADEVLEIAECALNSIWLGVDLLLIVSNGQEFRVVSLQEWVDALDQILVQEFGQVEHDCLLVFTAVQGEDVLEEKFDCLVGAELDSQSEGRDEIEIWLDYEIVFAQFNGLEEGDLLLVTQAHLVDKRAVNPSVLAFIKPEPSGDLLGEVQTNIANCLSLKHFLRLVKLLSHQLVEIVIENEVFEFGQLHGQDLLLDFGKYVICLASLQISLHENLLL